MFVQLALAALLIEAAFGYPDRLVRRIGHPVTWIGALITRLDRGLNRPEDGFERRRAVGIAAVAMLLGVTVAGVLALALVLTAASGASARMLWGAGPAIPMVLLAVEAVVASTLIAQRSLHAHVADVAAALERGGLEAGRVAVGRIVGRDPASLDEAGVSRAAIESLAENFSDGIVAPLFWLVVGGLPGAAAYKAINTADSMIGHRSERYRAFGWAAARLDDVVNLPASRLSAVWLVLAALVVPGASAAQALAAVRRDAGKHRSPNAGWPEAAMAGALGLRLAGPRSYGGVRVDDHWMGEGRASASSADIRAALRLYRTACGLQAVVLAAAAWLIAAQL